MTTKTIHIPRPIAGTPPLPIELLRLQRGVTRNAVAAAARLARYYLYRIERGLLWPSPGVILRLAGALGEDPEALVTALLRGWLIKRGLAQPEEREPSMATP